MYYSTLRFQNFLRLAYEQLFIQTQVSGQALITIKSKGNQVAVDISTGVRYKNRQIHINA